MSKLPANSKKPNEQEENAELEAFCDAVDVDEISFEGWQNTHEILDIVVPLFVSCEIAKKGGTREVKFSRCIHSESEPSKREKASVSLEIPPDTDDGRIFVLPRLGDAQDKNRGDLKVIIRFSD